MSVETLAWLSTVFLIVIALSWIWALRTAVGYDISEDESDDTTNTDQIPPDVPNGNEAIR